MVRYRITFCVILPKGPCASPSSRGMSVTFLCFWKPKMCPFENTHERSILRRSSKMDCESEQVSLAFVWDET